VTSPDTLQDEAAEHFTKLLQALADADKFTQLCISDELKARIPAYEDAVAEAAAALRSAVEDLSTPESRIAELDDELESCREQIAFWERHLNDNVLKDRVEARSWRDSYVAEMAKLEHAREQAGDDIQPFYAARNKAQDTLAQAQHKLDLLVTNIDYPYLADGRRTDAYLGYRVGSWWLWVALISGKWRDHPEADTILQMVQTACKITGYRTTDLEIEDMDRSRDSWDAMKGSPEPVPSGAELHRTALAAVDRRR
jgi:hypothetical protein